MSQSITIDTSKTHDQLQRLLNARRETESLRDVWYNAKCRKNERLKQRQREQDKSLTSPYSGLTQDDAKGMRISLKKITADDDDNLKPERYYTPLTRRSQQTEPQFDALLRTYVPVPQLYDQQPSSELYGTHSLDGWQKQVTKVVPPRPKFSVPAKSGELRSWAVEVSEDFMNTSRPHFHTASKAPKKRHFFVSPEWVSEQVVHRTGKAYRSNIVFG